MTSDRVVRVASCGGVVVARQKEQSGDECVVVDDTAADNADHDVVSELTEGIVEEEFDRVVDGEFDRIISRLAERGFNVVIIVEMEELASVDVVIHEIVEE